MGIKTITGTIARWYWRGDNGYAVVQVKTPDGEVNVKGHFSGINDGALIRADGAWVEHPQYGRQFAAEVVVPELPRNRKGLLAWLSEINGIGPKTAEKLVDHKGAEWLWTALEAGNRDVLKAIPGMPANRVEALFGETQRQGSMRDIAVFLRSIGVSPAYQKRITKRFGNRALEVIHADPYRLTEVKGIGFKKADAYAQGLGWSLEDNKRVCAGLLWVLEALSDGGAETALPRGVDRSGHTCVRCSEFVRIAGELLSVGPDVIATGISTLRMTRQIRQWNDRYFSETSWKHETGVASHIVRLLNTSKVTPITDEAIATLEAELKISLSPEQKDALRTVTSSAVGVLTGLPGTGKTTVVRAIVASLQTAGRKVILCAPTGKAARRLRETSGFYASTLHRALEVDPKTMAFTHHERNPLDAHAVVVDESSMNDAYMAYSLLAALPDGCQVIFVGDPDQLPSVGAGQVLSDMISAGVPSARLTKIFRQAQGSGIILAAHAVNEGKMPDLAPLTKAPLRKNTVYHVEATAETAVAEVCRIVKRATEEWDLNPLEDAQALCPVKAHAGGVVSINDALGPLLNPEGRPIGMGLRTGDKVLQLRNLAHHGISNGDTGVLLQKGHDGSVEVDFGLDATTVLEVDEAVDLAPGYAITIHKSQGSEYRVVIVVLLRRHHIMLSRQVFFTAMTRARELLFIVGEKSAIKTAVANNAPSVRWTALKDLIRLAREKAATSEKVAAAS